MNPIKQSRSGQTFDASQNAQFVDIFWQTEILPTLMEYIEIPNKSPMFDQAWQEHGYMQKAVDLMVNWCKKQKLQDTTIEVVQLPGRTPLILIEVLGQSDDTILLYGHLDKQPEMTGWEKDLAPFKPVLRGDKLYGRGSADDGYAIFSIIAAIKSLQTQNQPHARCVILIEACEESGSYDLPYYIDHLKNQIGTPNLVICLDSGCGNYEQLWLTTSLRGLVGGVLSIEVLTEGIHSGSGSGVVPSCSRIMRELLNRVEDLATGDILLKDAITNIPQERETQAQAAALALNNSITTDLPLLPGVLTESTSMQELILRRTWKAALSIVGCDGMPNIQNAGNVTLPKLAFKLSLRIPPLTDATRIAQSLKQTLETNPPYNARVTFDIQEYSKGWNAPSLSPWLSESANISSMTYYKKPVMFLGEGGSIPFMGMLGEKFPRAQFIITGVLGPASNAHGPNEFLHIPMVKKLTACIAHIMVEQFQNRENKV